MQLIAATLHDPLAPVLGIFDALLYIMSAMFDLLLTMMELAFSLAIG